MKHSTHTNNNYTKEKGRCMDKKKKRRPGIQKKNKVTECEGRKKTKNIYVYNHHWL